MSRIKTRAPARIDLAGGTLDLWPLHLFFDGASTINCAIDQYAEVEIETGNEAKIGDAATILLASDDRGESKSFRSFGELLELYRDSHKPKDLSPALWLHARVVRHFFSHWRRSGNLKLTTKCASPAGAGLGGSSALNIALCNALRKLSLLQLTDERVIELARDLETTVIDVPAGVQDYWSAQFGGIQAIRLDPGQTHRRVFYKQAPFIEAHVILVYTGQSRNSGINNWAVYKGFIDKDPTIQQAFRSIVRATQLVEESLDRQDFDRFVQGVALEWESRKKLAPGIATTEMLEIIDYAKSQGAVGAKVCGAGGGGCFIMLAPDNKKAHVMQALRARNVHVIDFKVAEMGCTTEGEGV